MNTSTGEAALSARIDVMLTKLREELLTAEVIGVERTFPFVRVGRDGEDGNQKEMVRWTVFLASTGD